MSDLNTEIKLSANAEGVETGVTRAKRSLTSLRDTATEAGEQGGKGLDKITAGTDRVPAGAGRAKRSLDDLAKTATQAGEQGSKGMAKFGAGGDDAARKVDAATRSMQNSLQRQIAALEAGGTATRQYQESLAKLRGIDPNAIKPFLDQLDAAKAKADRAGQSVGGLGDASGILRGQLAALAGSLTLGSMAAFVMQINDGVDALNDIKDATGSSIENISALEDVGKRTGASLDLVGSVLIKFNDVLSKATPKSDIALQLQAIGLSAEELRRLDPAEALLRTATALQSYADDANKARLVQDLFGKSVKDAAPFLNDLADKGKLVATVTTEQADEAARFNKELFAMQANIQEASRRLTGPLVTSINEVAEAFRKGRAEGKGFFEIANDRYWSNVREFYGMQQPGSGRTSSGVISTAPGADTAPPADDRPSVVIGPTAAEIAAAKAAADAAARASAEHRKRELAEQAKFYADMSGLQADFLDKLARAQKERAAGNISEAQYVEYVEQLIQKQPFATALTRDNTEATKAHTTAVQEAHAADLKRAQAQEQTATALADGNRSLRDEIDLIGLSEAAQTRVLQLRNDAIILTKEAELAELQRQSAITGTMTRTEIALEAEIAALKERNALLGYKYDRTALAKAMDAEVQDTLRRADQVGQGLANSLMQGGKSAWEYIKGLFRTELVMRVSGVFSAGAAGLFGGQTAMAASTGVSALSTASNAASIYTAGSTLGSVLTTAGQGLSSFTTALTAGVQNLVGLRGTTAQMTASLQAAGYWTGSAARTASTTAGASAGSTLVNAVPYATVALVVANALGLFRKTTTVGSGLMGELGGEINSYDLRRKSGTLFSGPDYSIRDNGLADQNAALQDAFRAMRTGAIQVADAFDISAEGIEDFTVRIGNELINPDTGGYGLKLEGLNEAEIQAKVQAALATANDAIAAKILGIKTVTVDTIKRTVTEVGSTWDDGYTTITRDIEEQVTSTGLSVRRDLLPWMQRIADASGPTAATLQAIAAYPDQLLQLAGTSRDALVQAFGQGLMTGDAQAAGQTVANQLVASIEMAMLGNASAQIFDLINRGIVTPMLDALLTGQSVSAALSQSSLDAVVAKATATAQALGAVLNDPAFAAAMDAIRTNVGSALGSAGSAINYTPQYQIQPATIATTTASVGSLSDALDNLREKFDSAKTSLTDTGHSLAIDLVRATGDEMTAQRMERELYLAGFADLTAAEQAHLAVMYDQNQAIRDQITAIERANAVAGERTGLERQLLDALGDTAAIRALEIAALDESNRPLLARLHALEDEKTAAQAAAASAEKLSSAYASLATAADSTASRYLSGQALTDYQYNRFAEQANGITGGGMVTGDVLQAMGIADIQAAVLEFVRGDAAPEARAAVLQLGASLIDLKQSALDAATATAKQAAEQAAAAAKASADQQLGLQLQIARLSGDTDALREHQLSLLDNDLNRALQRHIWLLEDQAAATEAATTAARSGTDDAYSALDRAVSAQRKIIETQRAAAQSLVQDVSGIFDSLQGHVRDLFGEVDASMQWQAAQGRAFIDTALAGARAGAGLPDADDLAQAISAARGGLDAQAFGSQAEADFARLVLANELRELQGISGSQLSEAERQLEVAESQLSALDSTLEAAKAQIDALRGVDTSVMSVEAAIVRLAAAVTAEEAAAAGGVASSAVDQVAQAYGASVVTYSARAQGAIDAFLAEIARLPGQVAPSFVQNQVAFLGSTFADVPAFDVGTNYVPRDMLAQIHEGEAIVPAAFNPWAGGVLPSMRGTDGGASDARAAAEIKLLREENAAQARALVLAVKQLEKLQRRWEVEGMPATRNETGAPTADVLVL